MSFIIKRFLVFFILAVLLQRHSFCNNIELSIFPTQNIVNHKSEFNVLFSATPKESFEPERFLAKVMVSEGVVKSFDSNKKIWVNNNSIWSNLPFLENLEKVKISEKISTTQLNFIILDTKTGKTYKSKEYLVFGRANQTDYISKLNNNLNKANAQTLEQQDDIKQVFSRQSTPNSKTVMPPSMNRKHLPVIIILFLSSVVGGYLSKNDKISLWLKSIIGYQH